MTTGRHDRFSTPTLWRLCIAFVLLTSFLFLSTQTIATQMISERLKAIDGYAMSGDPDRIRASIEAYKKLETIDSDSEVQWRLLRAYSNLFSELTCRNSNKEQKAAAKEGYEFAVKIDAANSDKAELVYYYADISGRYYKDHLFKAILRGFDPIGNCKNALKMDENIDYAGPHRCLGALYLALPWPKKDTRDALNHLQEAVDRSPKRVANRIWLARALAKVGKYEDAWTYIKSIQAEDFEVGPDVSSKHWANIYTRRIKHINQENIKKFAQMESGDECGELIPAGQVKNEASR